MLYYHITTGAIYKNNDWLGTGYSGYGLTANEGRNNPTMCDIPNIGPIPPGVYSIGKPYKHPIEGPMVMDLAPQEGTDTFGRSAFHIHGNNASNDASQGCIILEPSIREEIANSGETSITVIN